MSTFMTLRSNELNHKCRCCMNPSGIFIQLECPTEANDGIKKTYKELLYEITNLNIPVYQEYFMPQQLCYECGQQLKTSYKFIQQAYQVSQHYLQIANNQQQTSPGEVKNIEHLQDPLTDIPETLYDTKCQEEIKVEPLITEECYNRDIKEEIEDNELILPTTNPPKKEPQEKKNIAKNTNAASNSSNEEDADDDSDEPESLKGNDDFLSNEPLARRCDICQKIYRNEQFLKIHKRYAHMPEENKMPCPLCSYKATRLWALKVHMGSLHGQDKVKEYFKPVPQIQKERHYSCSHCPRSYVHKHSLRNHIKAKHLNKSKDQSNTKAKEKQFFLCTFCGQSFNTKHSLESHNLTHSDNRPFSCDVCDKTFKRLKGLQLHLLVHSDEKPHECKECGKAFKRVDKLKVHMKVHSQLRPYKCSECHETFKYQNVLKTHMNSHTNHFL